MTEFTVYFSVLNKRFKMKIFANSQLEARDIVRTRIISSIEFHSEPPAKQSSKKGTAFEAGLKGFKDIKDILHIP